MPASRSAVYASAVAAIFFGASSVAAKDCVAACSLFESTNQKYLIHESKVQCKKHNVSPRPTTEDICLSTFRAVTHSACATYCDASKHSVVEDACGAIAGTTWIPKHNAFRSCKTGYKAALQHVPRLVSEAADRMPTLRDMLEAPDRPKYRATKSQEIKFGSPGQRSAEATAAAAEATAAEAAATAAATAANEAALAAAAKDASDSDREAAATAAREAEEASAAAAKAEAHRLEAEVAAELSAEEKAELEDEFVFPVTVEDGSVVDLVLKATDNVEAKVDAFCAEHMAEEDGCADQLLPIVKERMAEDQPAR